jgi:hypothetical protein
MTPQLKKFIKIKKNDLMDVVRGYILMRKMFIDHGVKDRQLQKGEGMTPSMYLQRERVIYDLKKLKSDARRFGLMDYEDSNSDFDDYFSNLLYRVDLKTPL